jgi:N-acetylglucosamine kinase-like BadF-type ATPase
VGTIVVPTPTLEAFGISAKQKLGEDQKPLFDEDGLPVYEDEKMDWLFWAVVAQAKMQARNKLISGTAELKDGQKIAATFEELVAEGERRGNAEALKLAKEIRTSFAAYVQSLNKTPQTQAVLVGLFGNKQALSLQADDKKEKFKTYLSGYAETLEAADLARYEKHLKSVEEACAPGASASDF